MIPVPPWASRLLFTSLAAAGLFGAGWWIGRDGAQDKAREAALVAEAEAARIARKVQDVWESKIYALTFDAETRRKEREAETERTIADLRSGTLRVRDRFRCPSLPQAAPVAGQPPAEEPGFRAEDAAVVIGAADEADTIADERNQCIASYEALRKP